MVAEANVDIKELDYELAAVSSKIRYVQGEDHTG
jgi:hypothetical protein